MHLRLLGYWGSSGDTRFPDPAALIDAEWDAEERDDVGSYLRSGLVVRAFMGYSTCRLCWFAQNGSLELTDGVYAWPQGLAHYVTEHNVRLPHEFVEHMRTMEDALDAATIDPAWWLSQPR
jgi:hypothetical protein